MPPGFLPWRFVLGTMFVLGILTSDRLDAQEPVEPQEGVEVQTRGPIHEAFAQPVFRRQGASPIIDKTPPAPVPELPPEQRPVGNEVEWIPGYWAWDEDREGFLWVSGVWRDAPPNQDWVPGYWVQVEGGWRWVSGYWAPTVSAEAQLYPPPPDPIEEAQPPAPDQDSVFVPGTWVYRETRYYWRPGFWVAHRPGWVWVSAGYYWTPAGYCFVDGYWDYDLEHRGLCFAPVFIDRRFYGLPDWFYRPRYTILPNVLLTSLFVQYRWNHYTFGDYYDPLYANRGYVPWMNFRVGDRYANPLFGYYRWRYRDNDRWEANLRDTFAARQRDPQARPPRTLAMQQDAKVQLVAPISQIKAAKQTTIQLQPLAKNQLQQFQQQSQRVRDAVTQRRKAEANVAGQPATQSPVKIQMPIRTREAKKLIGEKAPPPPPNVPTVTQQAPPTTKPMAPNPPGAKPLPPSTKPAPPTPPNVKPTPPAPPNVKPTPPAPPNVKPTPPAPPNVKPTPPAPPKVKPSPPAPPNVKPTPPQTSPPVRIVPPPSAQPPAAKPAPPRPVEQKKSEEKKKKEA